MDCVVAFAELGAPFATADFADIGANLRLARAVDPAKYHSLLARRGLERDAARNTQMQARALQHRRAREGASTHLVSGSSSFSSLRIMPANLNRAADARSESRCGRAG